MQNSMQMNPCRMQDRAWHEAYQFVQPLLRPDDIVLAPRGDWLPFPCELRLYDDWIDTDGATVVFLHKGLLSDAKKAQIVALARHGQCLFANEVFAVFSVSAGRVSAKAAIGTENRHYRPVDRFIRSASLRKRKSKIIYVHVPKAGGTSMWTALSAAFPSNIYYSSTGACARNPPVGDEYDLIGIHFSPSVIAPYINADDWVIGMVREPTQRLLSTILHCRRPQEDPATFSPAQWAMRNMNIAEFLDTEDGRYESLLQLIIFGTEYPRAFQEYSGEQMLNAALAYAGRDNVILAPSERSEQFVEVLRKKLALPRISLGKLNQNNRTQMSASVTEFEGLMARIRAGCFFESKLYDFIADSSKARSSTRRSIWRSLLKQQAFQSN